MRDDNKKKVSALAMAVAEPEAKPAGIKGKGKNKGFWWAQPKNTTGATQFTGTPGAKVGDKRKASGGAAAASGGAAASSSNPKLVFVDADQCFWCEEEKE